MRGSSPAPAHLPGTPDPTSVTPKPCGKPSKDNQCSSAASFYPVPLPLGLLPPLVAHSALGGRHPTGAETPPAPFPPISAFPPPHFPAVVSLPGTALLSPISMPSPLARSEGAAGAGGAPGRRARRRGGGHCPIEPARGGSGGLCSPHEKPIQVFLLPCTSRRGNAKPTGMKGTFCGAAHPAGRAFAVPVLRGEVASCKGQAPSSRSICVGFPARGRRVPRAELRGSISGLFPADTLLQGIPALPQQPFADFRANI